MVITVSCVAQLNSGSQESSGCGPLGRDGLAQLGWDEPVIEGQATAIAPAKSIVDPGVDAWPPPVPGDRSADLVQGVLKGGHVRRGFDPMDPMEGIEPPPLSLRHRLSPVSLSAGSEDA